jgi:hypothetical protein
VDLAQFKSFMAEISNRFNREQKTLYGYLGVAERLLPLISAGKLEQIGISKALEIKRALKKADGKAIPQDVIDAACLPQTTAKELRALLAQAFCYAPDAEKGVWIDFGGSFLTKEERAEFLAAVRVTKAMLGLSDEIPDHIQRKEILQAWWREFMGTHAAEVLGPQQAENTPAVLMLPGKQESAEC